MSLPDFLNARASESLAIEADGHDKRRQWAVVLGLQPTRDGEQWCLLWGKNLMEGVAGFGDTPVAAIEAFERAMYSKIGCDRKEDKK